jgi:LmbE family N-acetylglucosaminyl deacetylase
MKIAAVAAHPDDIELLCAGTMIRYIQKGHKVTFIIATNGEVGSQTLPNKEIAEIRYNEAVNSAKIIGADLIWLGFPDEFLFNNPETRLAFLNALRKAEAEVVFTHYPDYYNCDHNAVSTITNEVGILQSVKNIKTEFTPTPENPYLYFMDTLCCKCFEPEEFVDITDVFEIKKEALLAHNSQNAWLKGHSKIDCLDMMTTQSKIRGYQSGVKYAEAFIGVKTYPRVTAKSFLPQYL